MTTPSASSIPSPRKARGAFFTPEPLARFLTDWAIRSPADAILEPSCGEAAFLLAAASKLTGLANTCRDSVAVPHLDGIELHPESAQRALSLLNSAGIPASVEVGDFFDVKPTASYDAVIGNPPYIRYQEFTGGARARSREAALRAGVALTNLASSWAAFTVHASLFLKPGGRLALVLPAELLTVNYAAGIRRMLMEKFARVGLVLFEERVFPGVLEEVVLLMADDYANGPTEHCRIYQARNADDLPTALLPRLWRPDAPESKWTPSLLSAKALTAYADLAASAQFSPLQTWGETTLGMVTGNNRYFALSPQKVADLRLRPMDLIPVSPPGSRHLRGLSFTQSALTELGQTGSATWLFRPADEPSPAARDYIAQGEAIGVDRAYKCRVRSPWWRTPFVPPADLLLTYMNADTPRLCANSAKAHHLNSVHGVYLNPALRHRGRDLLPLAALNTVTLLGAETVGRSYGGGMLKLEPKEADRLPVPSPALIEATCTALTALRPQLATHLRNARLMEAVRLVDNVILIGELGLSRAAVRDLREAHAELTARRTARGSSPRDTNR
ncbi:N-6 DNA methylase [Trebonia sp.]|uniref:HsdM family class I SAM-dependent methyltransferase n=1 Tax=Trebonia sp. TaxID=2767075 RepID=UPI00260BC661|nr:N-6 DNA methylase [Trebonia sp.]